MRVRYWDLAEHMNSQIAVSGAKDPLQYGVTVSYKSQLMEGSHVISEVYGSLKAESENDGVPKRGHDMPRVGHHDIITDIALARPQQTLMITASRDGVVKVWK